MKENLTILGGGITGLSAAYLAAKDGWDVTVLEGSAQLGGLIRTFQIGGNRLEHYYHHFFTHDAELLWLLSELNLTDSLEFKETTMGVFRDNKIYDFNTPGDLLKFSPMSILDKVRFGLSSIYLGKFANWRNWEDISALAWFYKYAGKQATESLWKPMLEIKFGPYAKEVPLAWMIGRLKQRMNSRKGIRERLGYLNGSLQILLDALVSRLQEMGAKIILKAQVKELLIENNILYGVDTTSGKFKNGLYLATLPVTHLAPLLKKDASDYASELVKIKYFGAICMILELDRPLSHIYWLNVADPGFPFGGIIEHTNFIPPDKYNGSHIVYLSRYFDNQTDPLSSASASEVKSQMLKPITQINSRFKHSWIKNLYFFRTNTSAIVCDLNFSQKVPNCVTPIKNLFLANMSHIYPDERSCNNSIRVAAQACKKMGIDSSVVPFNSSLAGKIGMEVDFYETH